MKLHTISAFALMASAAGLGAPAFAQDAEGCEDHPALTRYPGTVLEWCSVENYLPYKMPLGGVTGYRTIGDIEEIAGRVTRNFYSYKGDDRTHAEVWKNISDALKAADFEIIGEGVDASRRAPNEIGGITWQGVHFINNAWQGGQGTVGKMVAGTSTSGGTSAVLAKKVRADDTLYVSAVIEQHSKDEIAMLFDFIETKDAETGLVTANAEAMGKDIEELGRTVIEGLYFDHDKATLTSESKPALDEAAKLLGQLAGKKFYIVGHTDSSGTYAYNAKLSSDRAEAVRQALLTDHDIDSDRLQAVGIGPVSPRFTNATDGGKEKNRRVELVEQ